MRGLMFLVLSLALFPPALGKPMSAGLVVDGRMVQVPGGLDPDQAVLDPELGKKCVRREELVEAVERVPRVQCDMR